MADRFVFVTVGSTDFDTLVKAVDRLCAPAGILANYDVEMQIGEGNYEPAHAKHFRFAPSLPPYFERPDLVIAHGGLGTAVEAIGCGCRLLAVANPDRYDHHQEDLLHTLAEGADEVFVNGDFFIRNARALDPVFKARMFAEVQT